jgi:hypothetical protein
MDLEKGVASVAEPKIDEAEAIRLAGELKKLHEDGGITDPDDPVALLPCAVGGTYIRKADKKDDTGPYRATPEQLVVPPPGLTRQELQARYQRDLEQVTE